MNFKDYQS